MKELNFTKEQIIKYIKDILDVNSMHPFSAKMLKVYIREYDDVEVLSNLNYILHERDIINRIVYVSNLLFDVTERDQWSYQLRLPESDNYELYSFEDSDRCGGYVTVYNKEYTHIGCEVTIDDLILTDEQLIEKYNLNNNK